MDPAVFRILERKRHGATLELEEIRAVVTGATDGSWGDAELGAFLMAASIRGLDAVEAEELTRAMLESGDQWDLARDLPKVGDKHSTGGVGDGISLLLAPVLAACDRPVVMLAGRGLGHTGGTIDKLEAIPGLDLSLDRAGCIRAIERTGMAIGQATGRIAPADKRLYALRDRVATIDVLALICSSILSKKLAVGAAGIVFDLKCGNGAFMDTRERADALAHLLVDTARAMGREARAVVTDMNQPLGRWVGHTAELKELYECFDGDGADDFLEVTWVLCEELAALLGSPLERAEFDRALASGRAREVFEQWAALQGADRAWLAEPPLDLAPIEVAVEAPRAGHLARVDTKRLGETLAQAGGGRLEPGGPIDFGVSLRRERRLGDRVEAGEPLARLYLRQRDDALVAEFLDCFEISDEPVPAPALVVERVL